MYQPDLHYCQYPGCNEYLGPDDGDGDCGNHPEYEHNILIAMVNFSSRLPHDGGNGEANANLISLAQHAPHDCGDPECPGVINKRKLELYDRFQECIKGFADAGLLT